MSKWKYLPRMSDWFVCAAVLLSLVAWLAPANLPVVMYKLSLVALAGVLGYVLDRSLFPYARPHEHFVDGHHAIGVGCMLRRAVIVAAAMIGVTMGL